MTSHDAQGLWPTPCRRPTSYRDLQHAVIPGDLCGRYINGQAAFDGLIEVAEQLFKSLTLSGATWYSRDFRPKAAFLSFMNDDLYLHTAIIRSVVVRRRASNAGVSRVH